MKSSKVLIKILMGLFLVLSITACNQIPINSPCLNRNKPSLDTSKYKNIQKFSNAKMFNVSVYIKSTDVNTAVSNIKERLKELKNLQVESISQSESSYSFQAYLPISESQNVTALLSNAPGIYSFSSNYNNVGYSYVDSVQRYLGFMALLDNFDRIGDIIKSSNPEVDAGSLKKMIGDQASSYESSIMSYEKQVNKCYLQISISQK